MFDIAIKNARVADGSGNPWYYSDVCIKNGRIEKIGGAASRAAAKTEIDGSGLVASPGFIDVHTHADAIFDIPRAENMLRQGVTTVVSGNCGDSVFPVGEALDKADRVHPAINYATLAGHNTIRKKVMSMKGRAGKKEIFAMCKLAENAMKEGALGISTGLFYLPGAFADTGELIEISKIVAGCGGIYASHKRSAGGRIFEAIKEMADISCTAKLPVHISHLKLFHKKGRNKDLSAGEVLGYIRDLRQGGVDMTCDVYPYSATNTDLSSVVIPGHLSVGGELAGKLKSQTVRRRIKKEVENKIAWMGGGENIVIVEFKADKVLEGKTLKEIAVLRSRDVADTAVDIVSEGNAGCIFHGLRQEDVDLFIRGDFNMVASDGGIRDMSKEIVHPRNYGTFPLVLRRYVNEKKSMGMEEAVHKMTFFPASRFGIKNRGLLAEGFHADMVVFNPDKIRDRATYRNPHRYPEGIACVIVNGKTAFKNGRTSAKGNGKAIRRH